MSQIFVEGDVVAHIINGEKETAAVCFDRRDDEFKTAVVIDLLAFLPLRFQQDEADEDAKLPTWQFLIEAIQACVKHQGTLWKAWEHLKDDSY